MKSKKFEKKLTLNKKTIANLKNEEMKKLQGGIWKSMRITACTCGSCPIPC
jgi:natural product precursor